MMGKYTKQYVFNSIHISEEKREKMNFSCNTCFILEQLSVDQLKLR